MAKRHVDVMITAFRDGFQSSYGARVLTQDFLPAVEAAVAAGLNHFEVGGGARFQSLYFYCNEDAFDMMDSVRKAAGPQADLQTLARGVNVVGLDSQSSDIIKMHAELFKKHGITTIRNFDALNDVDNLDYSGRCIVEAGLGHEICVTLMALPPAVEGAQAHTPEFYMQVLQNILDAQIPFDSVCFKDASGTATPATVYETIKLAKAGLPGDTPIHFHTHETAGTSIVTYMAALDAGATTLDCSMAPASGGTCQPDVVVMWHALRGSDYDLGIDINKVLEAEKVFKDCMKDYENLEEAARVEPMIPFSPMPGGALTTNTQMMRDNDILDKFPDVIAAMGEVVERGGFGTSVTPVSQFYFQQAFNNVMIGPWQKIAEGYGKMVLGYFGRMPVAPDPEIVKLAREQIGLDPTTESPRLINDGDPTKGVKAATKMLEEAGLEINEENIFITATCREKGIAYLKGEAVVNVRKKSPKPKKQDAREAAPIIPPKPEGTRSFDVYVNGEYFQVEVGEPEGVPVVTRAGSPPVSRRTTVGASAPAARTSQPAVKSTESKSAPDLAEGEVPIVAPLPGLVVRYEKQVGDRVKAGETVVVLEAMKMNNNIESPCDGEVSQILVEKGSSAAKGNVLCIIRPL